jgi:acyl-CoA dehydrogenase
MSIDFTMPAHALEVRDKIRAFIKEEIEPAEIEMQKTGNWREGIIELRRKARQRGLWLPHMPQDFGGLGLGPMATGADEVHMTQIARHAIEAFKRGGTTRAASGGADLL